MTDHDDLTAADLRKRLKPFSRAIQEELKKRQINCDYDTANHLAAGLDARGWRKVDEPKTGVQVVLDGEGNYSHLYCYTCRIRVPNTANHEMQREGAVAYSHVCPPENLPHEFERTADDYCDVCGGNANESQHDVVGELRPPVVDEVSELRRAVDEMERDFPLPRCEHRKPLADHAGELLEPSCGCRLVRAAREANDDRWTHEDLDYAEAEAKRIKELFDSGEEPQG